jgi:hypothetical protein
MWQRRSCELGIDGRFVLGGRGAVVGYCALSSGCSLFAVFLRIGGAIVVAVTSAFVLVLGTGATNRALAYATISSMLDVAGGRAHRNSASSSCGMSSRPS